MKRQLKTEKQKKAEQLQKEAVKMLKRMSGDVGSDWLKLAKIATELNITQNYAGKLTKAYRDETRATNA